MEGFSSIKSQKFVSLEAWELFAILLGWLKKDPLIYQRTNRI